MAKVCLFIGGASRSLKSTVAASFESTHPSPDVAYIHSDQIRKGLWRQYASERDQHPDLFSLPNDRSKFNTPEEWTERIAKRNGSRYLLERQLRESSAIWRLGTKEHLDRAMSSDARAVLLEGVVALPEHMNNLPYPTIGAYLGNHSPLHTETLWQTILHAQGPEDTWMHGWTRQQLEAYMEANRHMSDLAQQNAAALPETTAYFDTSEERPREERVNTVAAYLCARMQIFVPHIHPEPGAPAIYANPLT